MRLLQRAGPQSTSKTTFSDHVVYICQNGSVSASTTSCESKARCLVSYLEPYTIHRNIEAMENAVANANTNTSRTIVNEAAAASPIHPLINMGQGFL